MSETHNMATTRQNYTPTIGELEAFIACANTGLTTRAAKALNLTQSAISRSVNSLEGRLGVRLFHRVRKRLVLSDAGRAFQHDAQLLLEALERATIKVMAFGGRADLIRLAVLPTFANTWLIPRLPRFLAMRPDVTFDIVSRLHPVDFEAEPFDAAIQRTSGEAPTAGITPLLEETLIVVAARSVVPEGNPLQDAEIAALPLLQQASRPSLWMEWFENAGMDPRTILRGARFEQFGMVINAAVAGLGVALVPELHVEEQLRQGSLRCISSRRLTTDTPYSLIVPGRAEENATLMQFRDWLAHEASGDRAAARTGA